MVCVCGETILSTVCEQGSLEAKWQSTLPHNKPVKHFSLPHRVGRLLPVIHHNTCLPATFPCHIYTLCMVWERRLVSCPDHTPSRGPITTPQVQSSSSRAQDFVVNSIYYVQRLAVRDGEQGEQEGQQEDGQEG